MAVRFGSQQHPSGGLRFGSQEYAAVSAVAGVLNATESWLDVFAADSYPRINGALAAGEAGSDTLAAGGTSSLLFTMQAREASTPDGFAASGVVTVNLGGYRFGAQTHPLGGLRFGAQSWAALGPNGPLVATESGSDGFASAGFLVDASYTFAAFDILDSFVAYSSESIGAGISGTLDTGNKVMLPVSAPGGISFTWETNDFGNPSLRLAHLVGAQIINDVPWYVWDGSTWTAATFDASDAMQGAVFMVEAGADIFSANAQQTRYGAAALVEAGEDVVAATGAVAVRGSVGVAEVGADTFAANGAPGYSAVLTAYESGDDVLAAGGTVAVAGVVALTESSSDAFAAAGRLSSTGALTATESGSDAFGAGGFLINGAVLAAIESATPDVAAVSGTVRISGLLGAVEAGADAFASTGRLERSGLVSLVESGVDALDVAGAVLVFGALDATDEPDTFASTGQRESTGDVIAAELAAAEGGADRFVSRGRIGNLVPIPTFDGPIKTSSGTRVVTVRARRTAEAA